MAFLNTNDAIIIDKNGSIYSFRLIADGIELIVHEKSTDNIDKSIIVSEKIVEYDVTISEENKIDLICKKSDKSLSIYSLSNREWIESKIYEDEIHDTCGLKIISVDGKVHIFYYMLSVEDNEKLSIYHHYLKDDSWNTNIVKDIYKSDIIKPIEVIEDEGDLLIGYYDLGNYSEDIFISKFDVKNDIWQEPVNVTSDDKFKLYLDLLKVDDHIHITYSEYEDENLIIQYKKIKSKENKYIGVSQDVLSNHSNCTYPTLISTGDILWNVWTEYENVVSVYSKDGGEIWSNPYVWSESKQQDFARYKFSNNEDGIKENYKMNYSFSKNYPDLSLLGFGDLSGAVESFKKKEELDEITEDEEQEEYDNYTRYERYQNNEDYEEYEKSDSVEVLGSKLSEQIDEINSKLILLEKEMIEMKKRLKTVHTKFENTEVGSLDKRVSDIENHIYRRRSPFLPRT